MEKIFQFLHTRFGLEKQQTIRYVTTLGFLAAVFLPRLLDLGTILTVDEPLWLSRGQTFINGFSVGDFGKTLVAGQPGVTTAWLVGLSSPWKGLAAGQAAIALTTGILVLINTYFFRILLGKKWGTITGLFLALDPFLLAHSRVAHTDALLALFYLASLTSLLSGLVSPRLQRRYIGMSAFFGGLAILTKIFGLILVPTVLLGIGAIMWRKKEKPLHIFNIAGLWLSVCILTVFFAWPALWSHADKVYTVLSGSAQHHGEGSRSEETSSSSWYYAREVFFRLSVPVTILLPFALWQLRRSSRSKHAAVIFYLLTAGVVFALVLNTASDKSDRYMMFAHIVLLVAAPLGLRMLEEHIATKQNLKKWALVLIALPLVYLVVDNMRLHPYYLAHYNRFYRIEADHKLGWGEGLEQASRWIEDNHPGTKVLTYYPRVVEYFYPGEVESITHLDDAHDSYAVLYRSMFERAEDSPETDILNQFFAEGHEKPEHVITINGIPYAWIFPL